MLEVKVRYIEEEQTIECGIYKNGVLDFNTVCCIDGIASTPEEVEEIIKEHFEKFTDSIGLDVDRN